MHDERDVPGQVGGRAPSQPRVLGDKVRPLRHCKESRPPALEATRHRTKMDLELPGVLDHQPTKQ
eukprot:9088754-Lingulodinium_polyedra.AAC.1